MKVTLKAPVRVGSPETWDLGEHATVTVGSFGVAVTSEARRRLLADVKVVRGTTTLFVVDGPKAGEEHHYYEVEIS